MQKTIQLSLLSVALLSQLHADNQYTLENINVTASQGTTLNKKDVTDDVTVITKDEIEENHIATLDEALNQFGGLSMTQNGGAGKSTSMYIRGMGSKRILVLIDGVRYNDPTAVGATAEFSQIMLNNVQQIEIIKGAQSGVWGADASGGVVNIITSKAKKGLHAVANLEYGSYNSKKASMQTSYGTKKFDILVGGILYDIDGFSAVEPKKSSPQYGKRYDTLGLEKDKYINKSFNAKLGYNFTDIDRVEANIQTINGNSDYDSSAGIAGDSPIPNTFLQNRFYTLAYKHKGAIHHVNVQYNLSTFNRDVTYADWTTGNPKTSVYTGSVNEFKLNDKMSYMKDAFLRFGASYQKFKQKNVIPGKDKSYNAISTFATNYNKFKFLSQRNTIVTESLRYDKYNEFDNSFTGKFGAKQFVKDDFYISTNIGTGYNAPTLGQLYGQWGANPNLKPEKSLTRDITLGNDIAWITYFNNEITDLIEYTTGYVQTSGTSTFKGVEIGYDDYFFDSLGVHATYTYLKTEDAKGKELARRPKNQIDAQATYYVDNDFDLGLNAQYIGERYDQADKQGAQTGKYTVVNFVTNIKANKFITFYAKINNITDKYYQTVDGYATAGRSLYVGLNAKY